MYHNIFLPNYLYYKYLYFCLSNKYNKDAMNFQEFKQKYENLVFAPLELEPPPLDSDKLLAWTKENSDFELREFQEIDPTYTEEKHIDMIKKCEFPLFTSFRVCTSKKGWNKDFVDNFPDIIDWSKSLPLPEGKKFLFAWLYQHDAELLKKLKRPLCSSIHTDELSGFGLRFFLENNKNNLYFYGTKKTIADITDSATENIAYKVYHKNGDGNGVLEFDENGFPVPNEHFYNKPVKVKTRKNTAFLLGQVKAAHFIMHEHSPKFTFSVQPEGKLEHRYDYARIDKEIQAALQTRSEEFIWHEDLVA